METKVNLEQVKKSIELFHQGQFEVMRGGLADDIVWHVPHIHPLSEDVIGADNVIKFFQRVQRETNGTFRGEVIDLLVNQRRIVALMRITAERKGKLLDQRMVSIWTLGETGQVVERELFMEDCEASLQFWSY